MSTDNAPDWQCPACEIAYNKGAGAAQTESYGRPSLPLPTKSATGSGVSRWLVVLLVLGVGVWAGKPVWQAKAAVEAKQMVRNGEQPAVTLYATDWCGYCAATRDFFNARGIRYTELDIEKSSAANDEHRRLGGNGVPLIVIGNDLVHGYNEAELRNLLKPWLRGA